MKGGIVALVPFLILFLIILVIPLYNFLRTRSIRSQNNHVVKERGYIEIYIVYGVVFLIIALFWGELWNGRLPVDTLPAWSLILFWIIVAYILLTTVLPLILLPFNSTLRESVRSSYDDRLYPVTGRQLMMFVFVAVTVGIGEEVMYRGFLMSFAADELSVGQLAACSITAVIFGLSHFMQGVRGIVNSCLFGFAMGLLTLMTGSLALPIVIHILYDLKPILIARSLASK
ncbi:CPBP family intramembrane glutamic endopeptidase [Paenibacillus sp. NPDC058071]|uniref:CPBP family intramembrane glutamic endopeptidase n=1 Tax=Paenibacillus sp. NPDC058071 TaxID=3346326 RepID=UPI0036DB1046